MKELIIVRHGQADHMVSGKTGGWTDSHLTDLGREQAKLTGQHLAGLVGDRAFDFYSSDLARAAETAELIGESISVRPVLVSNLRELNNGQAANLSQAEAEKIANPITEPLADWRPYPGAESWREMSDRVVGFLESVREGKDLALMVLHGGSANAAILWWLDLGIAEANISFELDPCSISRFNVNRWNERSVVKANDTAHIRRLS